MLTGLKKQIGTLTFIDSATILGYHGVVAKDVGIDLWRCLHKDRFEEHVAMLSRDYNCVPLHDMVARFLSGEAPSGREVAITFDDGYANNFTVAYPILKKYNVPATIFVASRFVGQAELKWDDYLAACFVLTEKDRAEYGENEFDLSDRSSRSAACKLLTGIFKKNGPDKMERALEEIALVLDVDREQVKRDQRFDSLRVLSGPQILEMVDSGLITVGPHTRSHCILTTLPDKLARDEMIGSSEDLRHYQGDSPVFSYPNGTTNDFSDVHIAILKDAGFAGALSTIPGRLTKGTDPFRIPRLMVGAECTAQTLSLQLAGVNEISFGKSLRGAVAAFKRSFRE